MTKQAVGDMTWDEDSVSGRSGGGRVRTNSSFRDKMGATSAGNIEWTYNGNLWKARARSRPLPKHRNTSPRRFGFQSGAVSYQFGRGKRPDNYRL
jgi:hypothetical protein